MGIKNLIIKDSAKVPKSVKKDLANRFTHHPPKEELQQVERYQEIRDKGHGFAATLECLDVPDSREKSIALTKIEEAVMWANAAIARNE